MEYWWAERSISSMINENLHKTDEPHSNLSKNENDEYKQNLNLNTHSHDFYDNNNGIGKKIQNVFTTPSAMNIASILISSSKSKYNPSSLLKTTGSIKNFNLTNNLQLCFS